MTPTTRPLLAAFAAIATVATLTACTGSDLPQPSPTPSVVATTTPPPSPTPTLSEQDQNIADAKDTYVRYIAAYDAAAQAGFVDRDLTIVAFEFTSADAREAIVAVQAAFEQNGLSQVGSTDVRAVTAIEYQEDSSGAGLHGVALRACVDPSASDTVFADGTSTTPTDQPQYTGPRSVYVQMQRQPGGNWTVASEDPRPEEMC